MNVPITNGNLKFINERANGLNEWINGMESKIENGLSNGK
jgi:hypothetical protein